MLRRSPAKVGLPRARLWTGDHITPGDLVCPTKSIPIFHRQERRKLPPTRGLQRQPASAASEEHQRPAQPRPVVAHRMGTSPPRRTDSSSAEMRLEQARRWHTAAREQHSGVADASTQTSAA